MKELDQMIDLGLAEISTSERAILALCLLIDLVRQRDIAYRFYMAFAGIRYELDAFEWLDFSRANKN